MNRRRIVIAMPGESAQILWLFRTSGFLAQKQSNVPFRNLAEKDQAERCPFAIVKSIMGSNIGKNAVFGGLFAAVIIHCSTR